MGYAQLIIILSLNALQKLGEHFHLQESLSFPTALLCKLLQVFALLDWPQDLFSFTVTGPVHGITQSFRTGQKPQSSLSSGITSPTNPRFLRVLSDLHEFLNNLPELLDLLGI